MKRLMAALLALTLMLGLFCFPFATAQAAPVRYSTALVNKATAYYNAYKTKANPLGYGSNWCASFVSRCAKDAGIPESVIPRSSSSTTIYNALIKGGARVLTKAQVRAGDLVFYRKAGYPGVFRHVGIMISNTQSIEGNVATPTGTKFINYKQSAIKVITVNSDVVYVRPYIPRVTVTAKRPLRAIGIQALLVTASVNYDNMILLPLVNYRLTYTTNTKANTITYRISGYGAYQGLFLDCTGTVPIK